MFELGLVIALFSYCIYFLGIAGLLYTNILIGFSFFFWIIFLVWKSKDIKAYVVGIFRQKYYFIFLICIIYLLLQAIINAVGLFGPEIGFDALWYHLTLPKLYLMYNGIFHIPGAILYYSDMPRLTEMLFTAGLSFGSDFWARIFEYGFGILTCIVLYKIGRKFLSNRWAILLPVIYYSNLVVGWESFSGYIDLSRTFFATLGLLAFLTWTEKKEQKYFVYAALFIGVTIATKLLALADIGVYAVALFFYEKQSVALSLRLKRIATFIFLALLGPLPYFVFAFVHTGNPIFPLFSHTVSLGITWQIFNPLFLVRALWTTLAQASDPINPFYLAIFPFIIIFWKKLWHEIPLLVIFALGGLIAWYITPQTGGGRYILPYLPVLSVVGVYIVSSLSKGYQRAFILFIFLVALISLGVRGAANVKFLPVIFHRETEAHFMQNHLQFNLGDFYDIDGYFAKHIKSTDRVLLYGFHNLYYVNFPFIDGNWAQKGDLFNYVAVQGAGMPDRFKYWDLVYFNNTTQVRLYWLKGQMWRY